tara:strand:- start:454 stop:1446 length:993 start_codon:yes stop_codon:yes gene_type:complete
MTLQPIFDYKILIESLLNKRKVTNKSLVKSGRLAFSYIISTIKKNNIINKIILPNLICDEVVDVARSHKIKIEYYSIDDNLNYNIHEVVDLAKNQKNIILFVNYFGFEEDHIIPEKLKHNFIIEDNAHILRNPKSYKKKLHIDYSFTSLRKLLPVLSGAEIYSDKIDIQIDQQIRLPDFGELKYSLRGLKSSRSGTSRLGHTASTSNYSLSSIDLFSKNIINNYNFSYSDIKKNRRKNFIFWEKYLSNHDIVFMKTITDNPNVCPYVFPCFVNDEMQQEKWIMWGKMRNITVIPWPRYHKETLDYVPNNFLRRILLFPVNHQFDLNEIIS